MASPVRILVLSTSHDGDSRSERLAIRGRDFLESEGADVSLVSLKEHTFPPLKVASITASDTYKALYPLVLEVDGLVFASPVYNWSLSGALKEFIEHIGVNESNTKGALSDKVVSFICAAGLPQGYMAFGPTALSLMLDFKCIVNPYQVFVDDSGWEGKELVEQSEARLQRSMKVMIELTTLLSERLIRSDSIV